MESVTKSQQNVNSDSTDNTTTAKMPYIKRISFLSATPFEAKCERLLVYVVCARSVGLVYEL